jgi:hypothetical protein
MGVMSKTAIDPRKLGFLGIIRQIKSTSVSMLNRNVGCLSRLQEIFMFKESETFFMECFIFFSEKWRLNIRQLFGFLNWRMPGTHDACVDRVQKTR